MVKAWETQEELGSHTCGTERRGEREGEGREGGAEGRGRKGKEGEGRKGRGGEGKGAAGFEERVDGPIVPQDNSCVN